MANGPHGVHSPLVYELLTQGLSKDRHYYSFDAIEKERNDFLQREDSILVHDFGAGSRKMKSSSRRIKDIAAHSLQPFSEAQALFRLVNYFKPKTILELGTSLGITTSYLASADTKANVITIEGSPAIASEASALFGRLGHSNVEIVTGNFNETLDPVLRSLTTIDFILLDGNHRYEPTLNYFNSCLSKINEQSVIVIDDIYWSAGMNQAWREISADSRVTLSLDFFHFGVVLFRTGREKEHFRLRLP